MKPRDLPRGVRPMGRSSGCIVPAKSFTRCKLWGTAALLSNKHVPPGTDREDTATNDGGSIAAP